MRSMKATMTMMLAFVLVLSGCGAGGAKNNAGGSQGAAPAGQTKTVQFWYSSSGAKGDVIKSLADEYNKSQSAYKVNATFVPPGERLQKLTAAIGAGSPPDVFASGPPDLDALMHAKVLASIDDLGKNAKTKIDRSQFHDILQKLIVSDNKLWAVPVETGVTELYYNADMFQKAGISAPPQNWDELIKDAQKLTDPANGKWGLMLPTASEQYTGQIWTAFLAQAGGKLLTDDGKKAAFNSPEGAKALQLWVDLVNKYKVAPLQQLNNATVAQNFATGNVGMMIGHPEWIETTKTYPFKTLTAREPGDKTHASTLGGWYLVIPAKSANPDGAYDFLSWISRPENNVKWNVGTGSLPTQPAVVSTKEYQDFLKSNPLVAPFNESLKTDALVQPQSGQFSAIVVTLAKAINDALYQKSTPQQALDKAADEVNKLLAQ